MDRRKGFDLYHTEIVIIRKEVCPTVKFENIDQVTFNRFIFSIINIIITSSSNSKHSPNIEALDWPYCFFN